MNLGPGWWAACGSPPYDVGWRVMSGIGGVRAVRRAAAMPCGGGDSVASWALAGVRRGVVV